VTKKKIYNIDSLDLKHKSFNSGNQSDKRASLLYSDFIIVVKSFIVKIVGAIDWRVFHSRSSLIFAKAWPTVGYD